MAAQTQNGLARSVLQLRARTRKSIYTLHANSCTAPNQQLADERSNAEVPKYCRATTYRRVAGPFAEARYMKSVISQALQFGPSLAYGVLDDLEDLWIP